MALAFRRPAGRAAPGAVQPVTTVLVAAAPPALRYGRSPGDLLLGSAKILQLGDRQGDDKVRSEQWQREAWDWYDKVGEAHYSAGFVGSCLSRVTLGIGVRDADGRIGPAWENLPEGEQPERGDDDAEAIDGRVPQHPLVPEAISTVESLRSPIGGQPQLLRSMGINLTVAGEFTLLGTPDDLTDGEHWEVLSTDELRSDGGHLRRVGNPDAGAAGTEVPDNHTAVRIWRPHPRFSARADSPFRPLLDVLEELYLLTRGVRATVTSRLAGAGILIVPEDLDYPDTDPLPIDSVESNDPLIRDIMRAATTPINDKGSAAAVVPLMIRATEEQSKAFRWIDFSRSFDGLPSVALRNEAVLRFAQGMDLPVEVVTGHAHTTFCVDEETEALTENGWRRRADLAVGDRMRVLDHRSGLARWEPIQALNSFDVVGEPVLSIETKGHSSLTTAGHRWPVLFNDTGARHWRTSGGRSHERLNRNSHVITAAPSEDSPTDAKWSDDLVELAAWWYTEGHRCPSGTGVITQAADVNPEKCARIRAVLVRLIGAPVVNLRGHRGADRAWCERADGDRPMARFVLSRSVVADLDAIAPGKVPTAEFIRSMTPGQLELFLHVSRLGDGWSTNTGTPMFAQKNPSAVAAYEMAAILSGRTTSRWSRALGSGPYADTVMHYCSISDRASVRPFNSPLTGEGHHIEWSTHTGTVWCPTTAAGTWLARRHGRVFYTGNSNAWQIDEATYKAHIEPLLSIIVDALTTGFLWPALMGGNRMVRTFADVSDVVVTFDASELIVHPNRGADAKDVYDRGELSGAALRRETGFIDDDMPSEEERQARQEREHPAPVLVDPSVDEEGTPPPDLSPAIAAAASHAVERAAERAGARLRSRANGKPSLRATIGDAPNVDVARVLGPENVGRLATEGELLSDEFGPFGRLVAHWCQEVGLDRDRATAVADECIAVTERHARARLWGPVAVEVRHYRLAIGRALNL